MTESATDNVTDAAAAASAVATPEPRRTAPVGLVLKGIAGLRQSVPALLALIFVLRDQGPILWIALGLGLLVMAINMFFAGLSWHRLTFHVGEEDIRVESGILSRAARSVPYERIQDVSLEQGPLARLFGLVEVGFDTGAGGGDDLKLAFLAVDEGEELRELVRARKEGAPAAEGEAAPAEQEAEGSPLFAMGPQRVLTYGLFEFSLAVIAVLFAATQQFEFLLPFELWDFDAWEERLTGPGAQFVGLGASAQILGGIIAMSSLIAVGIATGLVRTALREWGFLLERTAKGFRRRRGLLTRTDVMMPVHRVQAMRIGTRIIRRRFGWHGLKFVSLAQDSGSSSHIVAPFAKLGEIWPIARAAGFEPPAENAGWQRASERYRTDSMALSFLIPTLFATVPVALQRPIFGLIPLAIGVFLAVGEWVAWKNTKHALDARQILARRGWLAPRLDIAPRVKLQSVDFRQGPLARRHGYGTLHLGVAGGSLEIPGVPEARAMELRRAILASIDEADFSQLNRD